ncbi:glycosyl hydrolase family 17 protein [Fulvivirga sp.]|uniref:glycosyl hydrolase family 17 protein n=1 Tax=Fulvivirga sp. TaxID=1931237 RepID=UPI0032EC6FB3
MNIIFKTVASIVLLAVCFSCNQKENDSRINKKKEVTAKEILGNPKYLAISYGGYRATSRDVQPTIPQLKEDMKILSAMGIKLIRTYNVQLPHAPNILKAISELKSEDPSFEMYVMLGAWIDCKNAWTGQTPDHNIESEQNEGEIARAVKLANQYPDIVKILAVGNEAMVKWAESYYVQPSVILKWVNHLQSLKAKGGLAKALWVTSSDDFSSWGGGDSLYHTPDLEKLVKAVDYISMHTYPYHNSHYNPAFWHVPPGEHNLPEIEKVNAAMARALNFAQAQYDSVSNYVKSLGVEKPIHIGETGWATISDGFYGNEGSRATDEYKQGLYYKLIREWTNSKNITCFYFEAFDEQWKDANNPQGSENHFGLFTLKGEAKYPVWPLVDEGVFNGLTRDGQAIVKTFKGDVETLKAQVLAPPQKQDSIK